MDRIETKREGTQANGPAATYCWYCGAQYRLSPWAVNHVPLGICPSCYDKIAVPLTGPRAGEVENGRLEL